MFVLLIVPCAWFVSMGINISLPLFFVSMLMLPEHSFVPSLFPPFWSFFDQFSFFLSFASLKMAAWLSSDLLTALVTPLIWFSWESSFLFSPIFWLVLQGFLPIDWWVGLFCNICCPLVGLLACFARIYRPLVGLFCRVFSFVPSLCRLVFRLSEPYSPVRHLDITPI